MHERSLVAGLLNQIDDEMKSRQLKGLVAVHLAIGEFAGIEPSLVETAFSELSSKRWENVVQLNLKVIPLLARCKDCGTEFHVQKFRFVCPNCDHRDVDVIDGEEIRLVSLITDRSKVHEEAA